MKLEWFEVVIRFTIYRFDTMAEAYDFAVSHPIPAGSAGIVNIPVVKRCTYNGSLSYFVSKGMTELEEEGRISTMKFECVAKTTLPASAEEERTARE